MAYSTLTSLSLSASGGPLPYSYGFPAGAPVNYIYILNAPIPGGSSYDLATVYAFNASGSGGSTYDLILFRLDFQNSQTSATATGSMQITFSTDVIFSDWGAGFGLAGGWMNGSTPLIDGDLLVAGNYALSFSATDSSGFVQNITAAASFAAPAVPLPGAAGLAVCGLLGLSRRWRR